MLILGACRGLKHCRRFGRSPGSKRSTSHCRGHGGRRGRGPAGIGTAALSCRFPGEPAGCRRRGHGRYARRPLRQRRDQRRARCRRRCGTGAGTGHGTSTKPSSLRAKRCSPTTWSATIRPSSPSRATTSSTAMSTTGGCGSCWARSALEALTGEADPSARAFIDRASGHPRRRPVATRLAAGAGPARGLANVRRAVPAMAASRRELAGLLCATVPSVAAGPRPAVGREGKEGGSRAAVAPRGAQPRLRRPVRGAGRCRRAQAGGHPRALHVRRWRPTRPTTSALPRRCSARR